jgi:hypothetical protein
MKYIKTGFIFTATFLSSLMLSSYSYAHVMVAQHGTLNILDKGVFMVLSLPVSAFEGIDDDNDGKLSQSEFSRHRNVISEIVHKKVTLKDQTGKLILEDMILSPVHSHQSPTSPASQLIVMGRYDVADPLSALEYEIKLFGTAATEQLLEITATRKGDHKKKLAKLTVKDSSVTLF